MCGIIGYLGSESFTESILQGLRLLQNRGYDSVGIGFLHADEIQVVKYASTNTNNALDTVEAVVYQMPVCHLSGTAIGHTRWATHGGKTDANAHPHTDNTKKVALVHNGIIENFKELKAELLADGYTFTSQTDTEVIAALIGKYLSSSSSDLAMQQAIQQAVRRLRGTWALVIIYADSPNKMWVTRNGSPLLLGMEEEYIMVASEQIAFGNFIKNYVILDNHDLVEISIQKGRTISYQVLCTFDALLLNDSGVKRDIANYTMNQKKDQQIVVSTPAPYTHWMLKEIEEQGDAVFRALNHGGRIQSPDTVKLGGLDSCKARLMELNHLILLGCGTSFHAGWWSIDIFKSLGIMDTVTMYDGAEFQERDIPKSGKTGILLLSQSGETKDLHRCIQIAADCGLMTIGVVNVADSLIARETECGVYLNAGREVAVASTKSFTNQCVVLAMIAVWFAQNHGDGVQTLTKRKKIIADLQKLPYHIKTVLENGEMIRKYIPFFLNTKSLFLLGKGSAEAVSKEGALKIKEVTYIHAEGYSSSALKHGAFALICDGLPILLLDTCEEHRAKNKNAFEEVSARNAFVLRIADENADAYENSLLVPKNATFSSILANIYVQLLSYHLAVELGYNPDFPRNLAKVVTVE
jgi:glutamine---fructose-6-phosphate transaminase (isomerizing)